jgi:hypothetical protein
LDYQGSTSLDVLPWVDEYGCENPSNSMLKESQTNVAFIVRRGECDYYTKAINAKLVGTKLVIVILSDLKSNPEEVIPVVPLNVKQRKFQKCILRCLMFLDSTNIPPVIVVSKEDGDLIFEQLN